MRGCSTLPGATHFLGPGGWAVRVTSFPLLFHNLNDTSYFDDYTSLTQWTSQVLKVYKNIFLVPIGWWLCAEDAFKLLTQQSWVRISEPPKKFQVLLRQHPRSKLTTPNKPEACLNCLKQRQPGRLFLFFQLTCKDSRVLAN